MKCPYLEGIYFQWCKATKGGYIPSQFEFKEYCTNGGYKMCPGYFKASSEMNHESANNVERLAANGRG